MAEHCCVVALGITTDATKGAARAVGRRHREQDGAQAPASRRAERGLAADDGLLVVIDGAKALSRAVRDVSGDKATIQRCTIHKRRNVAEYLPEAERAAVDRKLVAALNNRDAAAGLREAKALATKLARHHPGAAASLREGLDELFTLARLGIAGTLARSLVSSNPIESMISYHQP